MELDAVFCKTRALLYENKPMSTEICVAFVHYAQFQPRVYTLTHDILSFINRDDFAPAIARRIND
jgi:hypothetical protein